MLCTVMGLLLYSCSRLNTEYHPVDTDVHYDSSSGVEYFFSKEEVDDSMKVFGVMNISGGRFHERSRIKQALERRVKDYGAEAVYVDLMDLRYESKQRVEVIEDEYDAEFTIPYKRTHITAYLLRSKGNIRGDYRRLRDILPTGLSED